MTVPRILWFTTSTNNTATFHGSLDGIADVAIFPYDRKWHDTAHQLIVADPANLQRIQSGQMRIRRDDCAMDKEMLLEAKIAEPDIIVYVSAWQGDFVPLNETLGELNQIAPVVHLLNDGGDHPWWPQLQEFERRGTFSLTVNIDGAQVWPGGPSWHESDCSLHNAPALSAGTCDCARGFAVSNCMTLLTPLDIRAFTPPPFAFIERPYAIGYAGNRSGPFRDSVVARLQSVRGFAFRERDTSPHSYPEFVNFLKHTRVSVSVPFTGTGQSRHVKGRVLESGFAGCCLLEWANDATRAWLTPRHEYWEYGSVEEAAELGEWLAHHPKIAEDTARALNARMWKEHAPTVFWGKVFERLGK